MGSWTFQRHDKRYLAEVNGHQLLYTSTLGCGTATPLCFTRPSAILTCLGYGLGPLIIAHVVVQAQPLEAAEVLRQARNRLAGLDGAAHILKG